MAFDRHAFWKDPEHSPYPRNYWDNCRPEFYLDLVNVTRLIVETMQKYAKPEWSILELGCGTGRNLAGLYQAGFHNLSGIEINAEAVKLGRAHFPELEAASDDGVMNIQIKVAPVEEVIKDVHPVDVIFTSGLLMHLPEEFEWVISLLQHKARRVIVVNEAERDASFHAWRHNYVALLEAGGEWHQVEVHTDEAYPPLPKTTVKRVFVKDYIEPEPKPEPINKPPKMPVKPNRRAPGKKR